MILQRFALYLTVNLLYIWPLISLKKMFAKKKIAFYEGGGGVREIQEHNAWSKFEY